MSEKKFNTRIVHKHDTEANWLLATGFTPKQGELIIYDIDSNYNYERIKIGDGVQNVNDLPFVDDALKAELIEQINAVDDKVDAVSVLVGDTSVSEQIDAAISDHTYSWNDLEDKPFGEPTGEVKKEIIFERKISLKNPSYDDRDDWYTYISANDVELPELIEGEEYSVFGQTSVCYVPTEGSQAGTLCLGDLNYENGFYYFVCLDPGNYLEVRLQNNVTNTTMQIEHRINTFTTINDEFIPDTVVRFDDLSVKMDTVNPIGTGSFSLNRVLKTSDNTDVPIGNYSVAAGYGVIATGEGSHAEGVSSRSYGEAAHSEGEVTTAKGRASHAEGYYTTAAGNYQHVQGKHNVEDTNNVYAHIVGNGEQFQRANIHTVDWDGNAWYQGDIYVGSTSGKNKDEGSKKIATEEFVNTAISEIPTPDVSGQISTHNTSATAHSDIRTAISNISTLVGDTAVSEQINNAAVSNQSDWSVNDETSPAYVKNRTHWLESEYIKFIDNETIPFIVASEGLYTSDSINNDVVFIEGNTYTFTIDGTSYDCVAHIVANYGYTYIGNVSYLDSSFEDTQEPFCVLCYNNAEVSTMLLESSGIQIATTFEGDSHAISLSGLVETYHKIDRKYLPHLVGRSGSEEGAEIFNNYNLNIASGGYAHAEGSNTTAEGWYSHAEGNSTSAVGTNAHAEGSGSYAEGINSHAEGSGTTASGYTSHAEGYNVVAASEYQHAQGKFNIEDANDIYAHIVGNGTNRNSRSNAHTISWDGIGWFANSVKIGGTGQDDEAAKELATQEYVDNLVGDTTVSEQINAAIEAMKPKCTTIALPAANWTGDTNPWSQVVTVNGVTENSKVDLQPTAVQIVELQNNEITLMLQNDNGVVTAWAIGNKPAQDYTMQVLITEVVRV